MPITLGQLLKETREALGISLAEASFQTKIRDFYLLALENDEIKSLPSPVQGKGFLKNYASFLKLSENKVMSGWYDPAHLIYEDNKSGDINLSDEDLLTTDLELENPRVEVDLNEPSIPNVLAEMQNPVVVIHEFTDSNQFSQTQIEEPQKELKGSQKIFFSIGEQLRKQRELLNLSLDDIERFTNIRAFYLNSLEKGEFDQLPSIVQGKGMLSNYSNFLNLDGESVLLQFADGLQTKRNEQYAPQRLDSQYQQNVNQPNITSPNWRRFISADLMIVGTLIIALFIFILWGAANVTRNTDIDASSTAPSLSELLLVEPTQFTATAIFSVAENPTQGNNNGSPQELGEEIGIPTEINLDGLLPINISIIANQRAFLKITSDNKVVFSGRIVPGNAYEFSGTTLVELLTGNAAALDIYFNQEQIGPIGEVGEVKYLIFSSDQTITTPTAQFTFTPTLTTNPTSTLRPTTTSTPMPITPSATVTPYIP